MTEQQKMLAGLPYDAMDDRLLKQRMHAKANCHAFNLADPTIPDARMEILKKLLKINGEAHFEPNFFCDYGVSTHQFIKLGCDEHVLKISAPYSQPLYIKPFCS